MNHLKNLASTYLSKVQVDLLKEAYIVARDAHDGQMRSSGEPYITHPVAVAINLAKMHLDHETLMAALLHDVIEDTPVTQQMNLLICLVIPLLNLLKVSVSLIN